jgi:hypothetical protein
MEKLDRNALKNKFRKGKMPSEQDFSNLIDSMVNILEEGFDKTSRDGLKISQLMGSGRLLSFYKNIAVENPQWFMELSNNDNKLYIGTPTSPRVLSLYSHNNQNDGNNNLRVAVGINKDTPRTTLDVDGTIASSGRMGQPGDFPAPADGNWHDITSPLTGCEMLEVVAGVGGQDADGRYALIHGRAMNAFNGKGSIEIQDTYFGNKCSRLELRWQPVPDLGQFHYKLQIRTQCSYGSDIWIQYHLTRQWFDPLMLRSNQAPAE